MKIEYTKEISAADLNDSVVLVGVDEADVIHGGDVLASDVSAQVSAAVAQKLLGTKTNKGYFLATPGGAQRGVLLIRLTSDTDSEPYRRAGGSAASVIRQHGASRVVIGWPMLHAPAVLEGIILGQYEFTAYQSKSEEESVTVASVIIASAPDDLAERVDRAATIAECMNVVRDLGNTPSNDLTPTKLAETAESIAKEGGMKATILHEDELMKKGLNLLLAVARGSEERATLSIIEYTHPEATKTVAIVGKGVTFDTGGISIKPSASMHEMKFDMLGAAAVLATMKAVGKLRPKVNIVALVPSAENMPGANAVTPGEIVKGYNGKTVEIHNTDAEGRLILADAMAYAADQYDLDAMVDLATLTGAVLIGLGHYASGVFSNNSDIPAALIAAGELSGDRCWELPLWDDYIDLMKGTHADLTNAGATREAGSITAAGFLSHFHGDVPWAHLDIAGSAWGGKGISYFPTKHPTGAGVRLLCQWLDTLGRE